MNNLNKLKKGFLWQLTALLVVSTGLVYATVSTDKQLDKIMPEAQSWASSSNFKPSGMSAALELFEKVFQGERLVKKWQLPYRKLGGQKPSYKITDDALSDFPQTDGQNHGVLFIISPDQSLAQFEVDELLAWVEKGNYIVYLDNFTLRTSRRLIDKLGMDVRQLEPAAVNKKTDSQSVLKSSPLYNHLRQLQLSAEHSLKGGQALATVDGACLIAEKKYGKGKLLISSCPNLIVNRQISRTGYWPNFQFIANWLATTDGDIMFDERCHGLSQGINVFYYFLHGPTGYVTAQILLLIAIAILSANQRFGALAFVNNRRTISNLEHINGLSNTYLRANARQAVIEIIWQNLRLKICKMLQISPHENNEKLIEELKILGSPQALEMATIAERCEKAVANANLNDDQLRELVTSCDKISQSTERRLTTSGR